MTSGAATFAGNTMFPLNSSISFERPYLSICRNNQKRKKPQFSKLSILTKSSIGSTKVTSNQYKKMRQQARDSKPIQRVAASHHGSIKDKKKKGRSNSCKQSKMNKTIKVQRLGLSHQLQDFSKIQKQTPMSRTVYKKQQINSISPLYSSLIFNSVEEHQSPPSRNRQLSKILDRTFYVLSQYKQECQKLAKQRDFFKSKYHKISSKVKKLERNRGRDRY